MTTEKVPTSSVKFYCKLCDYESYRYSQYERHLNTTKHQNTTKYNNIVPEIKSYTCECKKIYYHRASLYNHKKKCHPQPQAMSNENISINNSEEIKILIKENNDFKHIILDMIKNNTETQKQSNEIQEKMIEVCKTNNITNSNNTMNNSNNKTFNLQVFLNEQCKDAMNLSDFMESIQLSLEDLENMEKLGYVECMFKNIFGDMEFISIFDRPFHCSDFKRGIIYIKENGVWEKEEMGYTRLINAIRIVEKKNFKLLKEWTEKHPSFSDYNSPDNDKYVKLFGETMNGDKHNLSKLIRKLSKECVIDKSKI